VVDPANIVPRKYFGFQEKIFNFGWEKVLRWLQWEMLKNLDYMVLS
jgi:hypothetical protein